MNLRIVYQPVTGPLVVLTPIGSLPVAEIARKDVPAGLPYLIIDASDIPADRTFRDAWEADFSNPDGYGIGPDAWFAEQAGGAQ